MLYSSKHHICIILIFLFCFTSSYSALCEPSYVLDKEIEEVLSLSELSEVYLNFEESIEIGRGSNLSLSSESLNLESAKHRYYSILGQWGPRLSLEGKGIIFDSRHSIEIMKPIALNLPPDPSLAAFAPLLKQIFEPILSDLPQSMQLREWYYVSLGVQFVQPLTPLFQVYQGMKMAEAGIRVAEASQHGRDGSMVDEILDYSMKLVYAQVMVRVIDEGLETISEHVKLVQRYEKEGLVTHSTVLEAELELWKMRQKKVELYEKMQLAGLKLSQILQLGARTRVVSTDAVYDFERYELSPLSYYHDEALKHRVELQQLNDSLEVEERKVKVSKLEFIPKLALIGRYDFSYGTRMNPRNQFFVGIGLEWEFWDGLQRYHQMKLASLEAERVMVREKDAESLILLEVSQKYLSVQAALNQVGLSRRELEVAEERYRIERLRFEQGETVSTEVLSAQVKRTEAKAEWIKSQIDVMRSLSQLQHSVGVSPVVISDGLEKIQL